jgi:hypothetical protein
MSWVYIIVFIYASILVIHIAYFGKRIREDGWRNITASDHVAIESLLLNTVLLIIAVVSLKISVSTYKDALAEGRKQEIARTEQLNALIGARTALNSMVDLVNEQEAVLEKSLDTSTQQLSIIRETREQELAKPDIFADLIYPASLSMAVRNVSRIKTARDVRYELYLLNLDHPIVYKFQTISSGSHLIDFVRPQGSFRTEALQLNTSPPIPPLESGNRLFGSLVVQCPDCKHIRTYWVYWTYGISGMYYEGDPNEYRLYAELTKDDVDAMVSTFLHHKGITIIPFRIE